MDEFHEWRYYHGKNPIKSGDVIVAAYRAMSKPKRFIVHLMKRLIYKCTTLLGGCGISALKSK